MTTANYREGMPLSAKEREVIRLMCAGLSATAIGRRLGVSTKTVATHRARAGIKSGCTTSMELGVWAVRNGILEFTAKGQASPRLGAAVSPATPESPARAGTSGQAFRAAPEGETE